MALKIQLTDRHPLSVDAEGVVLPEIVLMGTADNVPHMRRITFEVSGQPLELVQALRATFKDRAFKTPYKLDKQASLGKHHLKEDLPADTKVQLQVRVDYYDSDNAGNPPHMAPDGTADTRLRTARGSCLLLPGCVVLAEPVELPLMEGGNRAVLRIQVERGPADARPRVRVKDPENLPHPQIRQKLLDLFNVSPTRVAASETQVSVTRHRSSVPGRGAALVYKQSTEQDLLCFELPLQIQLSEEAKKALLQATKKGPLCVPLVTEVPGGLCEHSLLLKCHEESYKGWVAIDFGTSNSTVTLFDPKVVVPDKGLPPAQEAYLRQALDEWINMPPGDALPGTNASDWLALLAQVGRNLGGGPTSLAAAVKEGKQADLLEGLRQLEICILASASESLTRAAIQKLQQIYHATLRVPPLESRQLVPVELERGRKKREVLSEMEIEDLGPPVRVLMGEAPSRTGCRPWLRPAMPMSGSMSRAASTTRPSATWARTCPSMSTSRTKPADCPPAGWCRRPGTICSTWPTSTAATTWRVSRRRLQPCRRHLPDGGAADRAPRGGAAGR